MYETENLEFLNLIVKRMYKKNISQIISINNLNYHINNENNLILFDETNNVSSKNSLVVGGACIDRCDAKIENLAVNFYFDILMPINEAISRNLNCAIYVDTPIETYTAPQEIEKWKKFVSKLNLFLEQLEKNLGVEIKVIRRDLSYPILDKILKNHNFNDDELKGLYDLVPSSKNTVFGPELLLHFKRSIMSYLPEFISEYFGKNIGEVIVCEEFSQCKAIGKARKISDKIFPKIYVDMPSISFRNRMHRSNNGKIGIFEENSKIEKKSLFSDFINKIELDCIFDRLHVNNFWSLKNTLEGMWYGKN